ncbi:MAG: SPOR domain-containing protein [Acidobacteriota bacterium]
MDEPRTHYQLSFTARQALLLFVGLLGALAAAYALGLMTGLAGHDGPETPVAAATPGTEISTKTAPSAVTPEALEIPRAVRGVAPSRAAQRGVTSTSGAPVPTSSPIAAGPTPSPGLQLFDDGPDRTPAPGSAAARRVRTPKPSSETSGVRAAAAGSFWVQALSAPSEKEARLRRDRLAAHGFPAAVSSGSGPKGKVYRVRVGPFKTRDEAEKSAARLMTREKLQPWIVPPGK